MFVVAVVSRSGKLSYLQCDWVGEPRSMELGSVHNATQLLYRNTAQEFADRSKSVFRAELCSVVTLQDAIALEHRSHLKTNLPT